MPWESVAYFGLLRREGMTDPGEFLTLVNAAAKPEPNNWAKEKYAAGSRFLKTLRAGLRFTRSGKIAILDEPSLGPKQASSADVLEKVIHLANACATAGKYGLIVRAPQPGCVWVFRIKFEEKRTSYPCILKKSQKLAE